MYNIHLLHKMDIRSRLYTYSYKYTGVYKYEYINKTDKFLSLWTRGHTDTPQRTCENERLRWVTLPDLSTVWSLLLVWRKVLGPKNGDNQRSYSPESYGPLSHLKSRRDLFDFHLNPVRQYGSYSTF